MNTRYMSDAYILQRSKYLVTNKYIGCCARLMHEVNLYAFAGLQTDDTFGRDFSKHGFYSSKANVLQWSSWVSFTQTISSTSCAQSSFEDLKWVHLQIQSVWPPKRHQIVGMYVGKI